MKKKVISALLLMAMLLSAVACGSGGDNQKETSGAGGETSADGTETTAESKPLDGLEKKNYGKTFTIMDANDNTATNQNIPGDEQNGEVVNDGLIERANYVSANLGITFKYIQTTGDEGMKTIRQSVMADEHSVDMVTGKLMNNLTQLAIGDSLASFDKLSGMSLDEKWWSSMMNESMSFNGRMYFTSGDISPAMYSMLSAVFMNKNLLEQYNIDTDFYELVNSGKWTFDRLVEVTKDKAQDLDMDDVLTPENDFVGLAVQKNDLSAGGFLTGFGLHLSEVKDGHITVSLSTEAVQNAIEKLKSSLDLLTYTDQQTILPMFKEGRAIALVHLTASGRNWFRDMNDDFMILPMPKWDENQENYISYANVWSSAYVAFPKNTDTEIAGDVAELLARYSYQNIRPKYYDLVLKQRGARDDESGKMLDLIFESAYVDFNAAYNFGNTLFDLRDVIYGKLPLASTMAKAESAAEKDIAKFDPVNPIV